jgi:multicomponent Na+:H+ antiporter subunit C
VELPLALAIGLLFGGGIYSILRPNLIRMVVGFGLLSNAVNLLMIACGGFSLGSAAPFVSDPSAVAGLMDPLPPDIILTAIVISFAVGALFLTICYVVYRDYGTDNPEELPVPVADDETFTPRPPPRRLTYEE